MTARDELQRLSRILDAEERFYCDFRGLLQREHACLVELDAEGLEEIVRAKEVLAEEGALLEESRIEVGAELAAKLELPGRPTLSQICDRLGDEAADLRAAHARLVAVVGAVRELVELNTAFTGNALTRVDATLELLGRLRPDHPVYGQDRSRAPARTGRLLRSSA
ncbi:MAG: flagellar protein FlgN [Myxococcota bacterium]